MNLMLQNFFSVLALPWQAALKETKLKLDLLTDMDILLMVEKGILVIFSQFIYRYADDKN